MNTEELEKKLEENTNRIIANMNELHSHEEMISSNKEQIQKNSYALDILKDYKMENQRLFTVVKSILVLWLLTLCCLVISLLV